MGQLFLLGWKTSLMVTIDKAENQIMTLKKITVDFDERHYWSGHIWMGAQMYLDNCLLFKQKPI